MKKNLLAMLKSLCITVGLNFLLTGVYLLFSHMVHKEIGQALLFLVTALLLCVGVCLFAAIQTDRRGILWASVGISTVTHLILTVVVAIIGGSKLSDAWPGYNNLAGLLLALLSLTVWDISVFTVTVIRSYRLGAAAREAKHQVKRARRGYSLALQPLTPSRARTLAILRGLALVMWLHLATGLLYTLLTNAGAADTMLSYIAFPTLWCILAVAYGLSDREHPIAYGLTVAISNVILFILPTYFLMLENTPTHKLRFILHLDSVLTAPLSNPEQMLAIGIFLTVWVAMIVFGAGRRGRKDL
jgi:hypothetical protein